MGDTFTLEPAKETDGESTWVPIPDGTVLASELISVGKIKMPFQDKETGDDVWRVEWQFKVIEDGDFFGRTVKGLTSVAFVPHSNCKMYTWVKELLNVDELPEGFNFNTDAVLAQKCKINVKQKKSPRKDGSGDWINENVSDVIRLQAGTVSIGASNIDYGEEPF